MRGLLVRLISRCCRLVEIAIQGNVLLLYHTALDSGRRLYFGYDFRFCVLHSDSPRGAISIQDK